MFRGAAVRGRLPPLLPLAVVSPPPPMIGATLALGFAEEKSDGGAPVMRKLFIADAVVGVAEALLLLLFAVGG